ncbi:hypothetical protein [Peribacillus alkalitolerans]|uniref:hypothetical protein n=1 Tax=Peribacillus alkalitolerans TaxID=1550385 RepID=UPI0013D77CAD|nr:hypothetical protein [Peribacillus alkalitolerans]
MISCSGLTTNTMQENDLLTHPKMSQSDGKIAFAMLEREEKLKPSRLALKEITTHLYPAGEQAMTDFYSFDRKQKRKW